MIRKTQLSFIICCMLLLFGPLARGQGSVTTLQISGPTTVCVGMAYNYTVNYYNGPAPKSYGSWTIFSGNVALDVNATNKTVVWGNAGVGSITATAIVDSLGYDSQWYPVTVSVTLPVTIKPLPVPIITTDTRFACQPLDEPPTDIPPTQFLDSPCQKVCEYSRVTYSASGAAGSSYQWDVIGGDINGSANGPTCTIDWHGAGPGKVMVTETTIDGCPGDAYVCIDIREGPKANIGALPDTTLNHVDVCKGTEVVFIDNSTYDPQMPIVAWRWDFGDGKFSNEQGGPWAPITHTYNTAGTYTVKLTVTNQCGCTSTDSLVIEVHPDPGVEIVCPSVVCENSTYMYHVNASCPGGTWTVIGGTAASPSSTAVTVTWDNVDPQTGFGYIIYNPAGSCPGMCPHPVAKKIPVVKQNASIQGPQYVCPGKQYIYRLPQWPTTKYFWSANSTNVLLQPTDQPNEIAFTANVQGTITLKCIYNNQLLGCNSTVTRTINATGGVAFVDTVWDFCIGSEEVFHLTGGNSNTATWTLLKPDKTLQIDGPGAAFTTTLDQVGKYMLSVKGDFCTPEPKEITVLAKPAMPEDIVGPFRLCRGVPTTYMARNVDPKHVFEWTVTEGSLNLAVGSVTDVTLDMAGNFEDTLRVFRVTKEKPYCRSDAREMILYRDIPNVHIMGEATVCPSQHYNYYVGNEDAEAYEWRIFPETMGSVDSGQGTQFAKILWNTISDTAILRCGVKRCDSIVYDTLKVYIRPLALNLTLSDDTICQYQWLDATVDVSTYGVKWYNGEENFTTLPGYNTNNFMFDYTISNYTTYQIVAKVDTPWGCRTSIEDTASVVVVPAPKMFITPQVAWQDTNSYCTRIQHTFKATWDPTGIPPIYPYSWSKYGTPLGTDSTYTTTDTGRFDFSANGSFGCPAYHHVNVYGRSCESHGGSGGLPPTPECYASAWMEAYDFRPCDGHIRFRSGHNNSADYNGYRWRPTDDSVQLVIKDDSTATYRFKKAGAHRIWYKASFDNGNTSCEATVDTVIVIKLLPRLQIIQLCDTDSPGKRKVRLVDQSTAVEPIIYRHFQYKHPDTSIKQHVTFAQGPNITFADIWVDTTSSQSFCLAVWTAHDSCWIYPKAPIGAVPDAGFTFHRPITCEKDAAVYFKNTSIPPGNLSSYWDFGDDAFNTQKDPYRVFDKPNPHTHDGTYAVKLVVKDMWGCKDSIMHDVQIHTKNHEGEVVISPTFPCQHDTAFAAHVQYPNTTQPVRYDWWNMKQLIQKYAPGSIPVYKSGYYFAHTEDQYGCKDAAKGDTVLFTRVAPAVIYGGSDYCQDVEFTLNGYAGQIPGILYQWERDGLMLSATGAELKQKLNKPKTYKYRLTTMVPNPGGGYCSDVSKEFAVTIHPLPDPPAVDFTVDSCNDYTVTLTASAKAPGTFNWSNGMVSTPIIVKHGGPYQVTYTNNQGCKSKAGIQVPKDLRTYLWIFPIGCYSLCYSNQNIITGPIIPFEKWDYLHNTSPFAGASPGTFYDVSLNPTGPGIYNMYLENNWCSVTSGDMNVDFNCEPLGPGSVGAGKFSYNENDLIDDHPTLLLAPNPAGNNTQLSYSFNPRKMQGYVEVYDVLGRIVFGRKLTGVKGSFDINLMNFASGTYHVILRRGSEILLHRNLNVTR